MAGTSASSRGAKDLVIQSEKEAFAYDKETVEAANATFISKVPKKIKVLLAVAVLLVFFVSFALGKYSINPLDLVYTLSCGFMNACISAAVGVLQLWQNLTGAETAVSQQALLQMQTDIVATIDPKMERVLYNIRLPRILVVMLVGAALAVAGASYQGMFKNPLTSPDLLGASAGASLGACIALLLDQSGFTIQIAAFCGGMLAVGIAVWLNKFVNYDPTLGLVLAGILVSTLFSSGMSLVKFMADANDKLPTITFWLMGSFAAIDLADLLRCILPLLLGFVILLSQSWKLNVLSFGDEEARSMGINTARTRLIVIFAATMVTSVSVAVAGVVGWIGLVIPHLARAIVGPNYKVLLPTSMFVGAVYLLLVDDIARLVSTVEIPIGILTAIMGVPFFVFIFKHNMKGWR